MWKKQRRDKLKAAPFPTEWSRILVQRFPLYLRLPDADRRKLQRHIQVFLAEKKFEGCGGLEITQGMKVCIAAQACLLLLHRNTDYYPSLRSILPIVMSYAANYQFWVDKNSSQYKCPFNQINNESRVFTYKDTAVVVLNSNTPYSLACFDLRAEPFVISVPAVEKERYFSVQLTDWNTFNYGYLGSRTTGHDAGAYLIAVPDWNGATPAGIKQVFHATSQFALFIFRTQLFGPEDMPNVVKIQAGYHAVPLSTYLHQPAVGSENPLLLEGLILRPRLTDFPNDVPLDFNLCARPGLGVSVPPGACAREPRTAPSTPAAQALGPQTDVQLDGSFVWAWLQHCWTDWQRALAIVQPRTVLAWHRLGFRLFWRWKSRPSAGRPCLDRELVALIRQMWSTNPTWGSKRIQAELAKLGLSVSDSTVRKYRPRTRSLRRD